MGLIIVTYTLELLDTLARILPKIISFLLQSHSVTMANPIICNLMIVSVIFLIQVNLDYVMVM